MPSVDLSEMLGEGESKKEKEKKRYKHREERREGGDGKEREGQILETHFLESVSV